jgi:hypothetical protein
MGEILKQDTLKFLKSVTFDWDYYVELLGRAGGERDRGARRTLETLSNLLIELGIVSSSGGYRIDVDGVVRDVIYHNLPCRLSLVRRNDAIRLAKALGYDKESVVRIR